MKNKLKWFLSLLVALASINNQAAAQSIKRQTIGSLGTSQSTNELYFSQTVGQPYFTYSYQGNNIKVSSGFQQSVTPTDKKVAPGISLSTISIFPNPATNYATVLISEKVEQATIRVVDLSGKVVLNDVLTQSNQYVFNCDNWLEGIYFVSILSSKEQQFYTSKIIISK